jgi:hypothetical protein
MSFYAGSELTGMLVWVVDELRRRDSYAFVSDKKRIDSIETTCLKDNRILTGDGAKAMVLLANLLQQYELYDESYFFYYTAITILIAEGSTGNAAFHNALLQIAKMIRVGRFPARGNLTENIFNYLIARFNSTEAASFQYCNRCLDS